MATLSLAAAAIHFSVVPEHLVEYALFGTMFLAVGWFQAFWAIAYVLRPNPRLNVLAIIVNLGVAFVWLLSRTAGLPFGPEPFTPEGITGVDVVATVEELILVGVLLVRTIRPPPMSNCGQSQWPLVVVWCSVIVLVTSNVLLDTASHVH